MHAGPLWLVVEFCEHGSLRCYLRSLRHCSPSRDLDLVSLDLDLLSFARQIANAMDYLSDMKVVHRDLAARNVLIASGMVAKVSDFGLSRDIYEGDAYLKTSKVSLTRTWSVCTEVPLGRCANRGPFVPAPNWSNGRNSALFSRSSLYYSSSSSSSS